MICLAESHPDWVLGYLDEVWWSRLAQPHLHSWTDREDPLRLVEQSRDKKDPDPVALACYGLLRADTNQVLLRFVEDRPVSEATIAFLEWSCQELGRRGKKALLLVWDNASWHVSARVKAWINQHNQITKAASGVRILSCFLPTKSPWLNPIEPHWVHGKRAIVEPDRKLTALEVEQRVCGYFACPVLDHILISKQVA